LLSSRSWAATNRRARHRPNWAVNRGPSSGPESGDCRADSKPRRQSPHTDTNIVTGGCARRRVPFSAGYGSPCGGAGRAAGRRDVCRTTWNASRPSWCVTTGRTGGRERSPRASRPVPATPGGQLSTTAASASTESRAAVPAQWWSTAGAASVALGAGRSGCSTSRCRRSDCVDTGRR
jgi:hypothetical protein